MSWSTGRVSESQSYWNAEATMLPHCRGALFMTPRGYMVLTGRKALEYAGSVSAASNEAIGGLDIMVPNGEAQYVATDLHDAYERLFEHYELTHVAPGEAYSRAARTQDPEERSIAGMPYEGAGGFSTIGEIFSEETNPGRKKPFEIRPVLRAVLDTDSPAIERWGGVQGGETAVVMHGALGGQPVCCIGIESHPVRRKGVAPIDGPDTWMSGTLFPQSSRKVARAIHASSGVAPVVVLANLSGFDGSPESLRERQLEFGAEIGRAVVNFDGPIVFCVIARYHGGAYVVFSQGLNDQLEALALEGTFASVIGGAPAAAVVFPRLVRDRVKSDPRVMKAQADLQTARGADRVFAREALERVVREVEPVVQQQVAAEFDGVHTVERAREVGSLSDVIVAEGLRRELCERVRRGVSQYIARARRRS